MSKRILHCWNKKISLLRTTAEIEQVNHNGHNLKMALAAWKPDHGRTVGQTMGTKEYFIFFRFHISREQMDESVDGIKTA